MAIRCGIRQKRTTEVLQSATVVVKTTYLLIRAEMIRCCAIQQQNVTVSPGLTHAHQLTEISSYTFQLH